jgi:NADPH:quinone reductase-like Zn-dependent oxidoreductase
MAQRIQYHQYGGPEVLRLETFEPRPLGPDDVLVRVKAAGANPMDWGIREGELKMMTGRQFPRGHGYDFAGVVEATGAGVTRLRRGDAVLGAAPMKLAGAFAELVVAEQKGVVKKPGTLAFEDAAALPTPSITALQVLTTKAKIQSGQAIFVHAALGAVGRSAVQLALSRGATVAGSVRASAASEAHAAGITPVVDFDFDPAPLKGRFDIVFDTAGTLPLAAARTLLKPGGRIFDIKPTPAKFLRSALPGSFTTVIAQPITADLEEVARLGGEGILRPSIARTVPLSQAIEALVELEQRRAARPGKLIVTPG